jgi:hypothetical protein
MKGHARSPTSHQHAHRAHDQSHPQPPAPSPQPPKPTSPTSMTPASPGTLPNPQTKAPSQLPNPYPAWNPDSREARWSAGDSRQDHS